MANWAKLQEDTHDMPVFKRARHGIHFKRSDGQIQAEFSGKPCHYLDNGIYKPIDTKLLLLPDGYYGCPHSPVRVHTDGHVKVDGSDYAQYVQLPSASGGLVDGDSIVRTFSFGEQRLWVTETGFRSEIVLNRIPTLTEARKLVATESGTLSKEYIKSLTTATDANGSSHTFSTLSAFRTWLASAVYPVTIDPDFTASTTTFEVDGDNTVYATARSTSSYFYDKSAVLATYVGQSFISPNYTINRSFFKFDTSSITAGSTVTDVKFSGSLQQNYASDAFDVHVVMQNWSSQDPVTEGNREAAFDNCLSGTSAGVWINTGTSKTRRIKYDSGSLNNALVTVAGTTYLSLRSSLDYDGTAPDSVDKITIYTANEATYAKPVLSVTYTAGASTHFMSLLGVGS